MPAAGIDLTPREKLMSLDERKRCLDIFIKQLGITKLRFTGGEPTLSNQLVPLVAHARQAAGASLTSIGITSNGLLLSTQLDALVAAGLTSVNISLDSLHEQQFGLMTRRDGKQLYKVLAVVYEAIAKGLAVKINCVLMRGSNDAELGAFVALTKDVPLDVRFIELMPFDGNEWHKDKLVGYVEAVQRLASEHNIFLEKQTDAKSTNKHDTTKWYRASSQHLGRVGFISSMTKHFCAGCDRLRITADGKLKVCLFGEEGLSLLQSFRCSEPSKLSNEQIVQQIGAAVKKKKAALGGFGDAEMLAKTSNRPMITIGG